MERRKRLASHLSNKAEILSLLFGIAEGILPAERCRRAREGRPDPRLV
jgi:hypothetical protein